MKGKKWMGSLLIGGALVSLLSLSAMAAETDSGFQAIESPASVSITPRTATGEEVTGTLEDGVLTYPGASTLAVSASGEPGEYVILLVEGDVDAPTKDCAICYIDEEESTDGRVTFLVNPAISHSSDLTLFITSNVTGTQRATLRYLAGEQGYTLGDVNEDNGVNTLDALLVLKYVTQTESLSPAQLLAGDATGDGRVNALDSLEILKYVAKLPNMVDGSAY